MDKFIMALEQFLESDKNDLAIIKDTDSNKFCKKLKLRSEKSFWLVNRQEAMAILNIIRDANFAYDETRRMKERIDAA